VIDIEYKKYGYQFVPILQRRQTKLTNIWMDCF